jgi:hypothetical protein
MFNTIWSGVFEGDLEGCTWHERNGFSLATDLMQTTSMVHRLRHEQYRLEILGRSSHAVGAKLEVMQATQAPERYDPQRWPRAAIRVRPGVSNRRLSSLTRSTSVTSAEM